MKYCDICGFPSSTLDTHHLLMGAYRKQCDKDKLVIHVCRLCHSSIHSSATAEALSRMLGQALFENSNTHEEFMKKYGKNFLPNEFGENKG